MIVARVVSAVIGYICGLFLLGYFIGKKENVDLHNVGSGNVGMTNTARSLGAKAGAATLISDVCKVFVAMFVVWLIFHKAYADQIRLLELYAGLGTVIGHNFPIYMKGKGGKGIACTGGTLLGFCPIAVPVSLGIFLLLSVITRYVSLGSIIGLLSMLVQVIVLGETGHLPVPDAYLPEVYVIIAFITVLGIVRHRANIVRLVKGTENKFSLHKKEQ
ncbi:MAG: glycerol-3-phosphate 1-O-acyltransferase PlsY [Lachnospiraceae bacterium]|nr:glycerol-3-phosphate 1-O-acyltransferase PlsY [Lachnospiraceae bacterium]